MQQHIKHIIEAQEILTVNIFQILV